MTADLFGSPAPAPAPAAARPAAPAAPAPETRPVFGSRAWTYCPCGGFATLHFPNNARSFLSMGLREDLAGLVSLVDVSMPEMLQAVALVEEENGRKRDAANGCYTTHVVPAERLIAAVYVLENYRPCGQAIAASIVEGRDQLLAVLHANSGEGTGQ